MSALLDSSVLVDVLRGIAPAATFLKSLPAAPACSEITRVEVVRGLRTHERVGAEMLFGQIDWIGLDEGIARKAGELGRRYRRSHQGISAADLVVAATAQELGLDLATHNVRHFPMFPGLRPPYRA